MQSTKTFDVKVFSTLGDEHLSNGRSICLIDMTAESTYEEVLEKVHRCLSIRAASYLEYGLMATEEVFTKKLMEDYHHVYFLYDGTNVLQFRNKPKLDELEAANKEITSEAPADKKTVFLLEHGLITRERAWIPEVKGAIQNRVYTATTVKKTSWLDSISIGGIGVAAALVMVGVVLSKL